MYGIYYQRPPARGNRRPPRMWLIDPGRYGGIGQSPVWSSRREFARTFPTRAEAEAAVRAEFDPRWADEPTEVGLLPEAAGVGLA